MDALNLKNVEVIESCLHSLLQINDTCQQVGRRAALLQSLQPPRYQRQVLDCQQYFQLIYIEIIHHTIRQRTLYTTRVVLDSISIS